MIVYNFGEINIFYCRSFPEKQYLAKRHVDIVSTIPVPSTICSQSLVTLFTKEFTALFKVRNICMELFVFYQKFITEYKLFLNLMTEVGKLYKIKQASGALYLHCCIHVNSMKFSDSVVVCLRQWREVSACKLFYTIPPPNLKEWNTS